MQKATLTIEEAAKMLGIGRNTAYLAAGRGEIPVIRVGRRFLVPRAAFERFLDGGKIDEDGGLRLTSPGR